jgi:ribonuclease HI
MTTIYTDGACSGNPGPGGWAWAVAPEGVPWGAGGEARSTNQRMEIMAVLQALRSNEGPVTIVSDSTYVVNCFRDRWYVKWLKNGWKNSQKQPVANKDLWEPLVTLYLAREPKPQLRWVKGHSGDRMNDLVDQLAVAAALVARNSPLVDPTPPADSEAAQPGLFGP